MLNKTELRNLIKQIISKKSSEEFAEESSLLVSNLLGTIRELGFLNQDDPAPRIMAYCPLKDEADISALFNTNIDLILPRMVKNRIVAYQVNDLETDLVTSKWGFSEPSKHCAQVDPETIDVIVIPGRAFDKQGNRVGRGKGHYDRFLPTNPVKIGVCFHNQLFGAVPSEEHDVKLNYVITNNGVFGPNVKDE